MHEHVDYLPTSIHLETIVHKILNAGLAVEKYQVLLDQAPDVPGVASLILLITSIFSSFTLRESGSQHSSFYHAAITFSNTSKIINEDQSPSSDLDFEAI